MHKGVGIAVLLAAIGVAKGASAQGLADDREPSKKPTEEKREDARVAPQLEKFVDAEYPDEAKMQGLEGEVVLVIDVDANGNVSDATVSRGAGHGFDEAAVTAAKQFVFKPATRGGKP